jgi:hypothetical protein
MEVYLLNYLDFIKYLVKLRIIKIYVLKLNSI